MKDILDPNNENSNIIDEVTGKPSLLRLIKKNNFNELRRPMKLEFDVNNHKYIILAKQINVESIAFQLFHSENLNKSIGLHIYKPQYEREQAIEYYIKILKLQAYDHFYSCYETNLEVLLMKFEFIPFDNI